MRFTESVLKCKVTFPEDSVLNHVFPFYSKKNGKFSFFGKITKVADDKDWVVTPVVHKVISTDNLRKRVTCQISDIAKGNDYTITTHSGRRIFIDEPFEIDEKYDPEHMPEDIKRMFVNRLYMAEFSTPVTDMEHTVIPKRIVIDGFM